MEYEDLECRPSTSGTGADGVTLKLTHMDRYLHGPTPQTVTQYHTNADIINATKDFTQEMMAWNSNLPQVDQIGNVKAKTKDNHHLPSLLAYKTRV